MKGEMIDFYFQKILTNSLLIFFFFFSKFSQREKEKMDESEEKNNKKKKTIYKRKANIKEFLKISCYDRMQKKIIIK